MPNEASPLTHRRTSPPRGVACAQGMDSLHHMTGLGDGPPCRHGAGGLGLGGHEALFVGQGLPADPVLRHAPRFGFAHRQEVAKGAVVLEFEAADAAGLALERLLAPQPSLLVVELVA